MRCSENYYEVDDDLSSTDSNNDSASDNSLSAKEDAIDINDIHVGDFAVVKYKYARSVKYYVGECMRKDGNEKIIFIFLERDSGILFKNRENVIEESAELNMVKHILTPPSAIRRGESWTLSRQRKQLTTCCSYIDMFETIEMCHFHFQL